MLNSREHPPIAGPDPRQRELLQRELLQRESILRVLEEKLADSLVALPERGTAAPSPGTKRRLHGPVTIPGKVTAITGMRRSGKTYLLNQLRHKALADGVSLDRLPFINFEDERLADLQVEDLAFLVESYFTVDSRHTGDPDATRRTSGCSYRGSLDTRKFLTIRNTIAYYLQYGN